MNQSEIIKEIHKLSSEAPTQTETMIQITALIDDYLRTVWKDPYSVEPEEKEYWVMFPDEEVLSLKFKNYYWISEHNDKYPSFGTLYAENKPPETRNDENNMSTL